MFLHRLDRAIAWILTWLIVQARPLLGPHDICPFFIGCTNFAVISLEAHCVPMAVVIIIKRLLQCNPAWLCKKYFFSNSQK